MDHIDRGSDSELAQSRHLIVLFHVWSLTDLSLLPTAEQADNKALMPLPLAPVGGSNHASPCLHVRTPPWYSP